MRLRSPAVSREHALVSFSAAEGTWRVKDLGSDNGTWAVAGLVPTKEGSVQDLVKTSEVAVADTVILALGDIVIRFTVKSNPTGLP
jgi:pSer/pThr/pTyr-binding forkhead associated (FHA) protein